MLNYLKLLCFVSICWTLPTCNAQLLSDQLGAVVPGGIDNVAENAKLCSLDTPGIIQHYGYENETRLVTTQDGYILTVHCLYNSTARNYSLNPVIAWHGLMDASHTFCLNYPNQSLAFLLADQGYYVCLPNARGNGFSQGYVNSSRNSIITVGPYWQFSWDEIAEFDVPAVIDSVLSWTGKSKVIYVGHSQGTTTLFALLATKPVYNEKISVFVALAPVAYFSNNQSPLYVGASLIEPTLDGFYGSEFLPHTGLETLLEFLGCTLPTVALCENLLFYTFGYSSHIDESRLPVYMCHSPSDFSWGQFLHYVQLVKVNKFQKYDFELQNQRIYGKWSPPLYDLTKVSAPVALFHSDGDVITANVDVQYLKSQLSNWVFEQRLDASLNFSHIDYVWGKDVYQIVYAAVFDLIKNY